MQDNPRDPDPTGGTHPTGDRLADWIALLHDLYPPAHAESWDAVGLQVGDADRDTVTGVLVALDVTAATLAEARDKGADLLIAHHPLLFKPLQRLTADTASGRLALTAARAGIAVAAAHTNLDKAADGTSHPAAAALELTDLRPLQPLTPAEQVKLVTFVPTDHTAAVQQALAAAGAGRIGDYEGCAFRVTGTGSFIPGPDSDPYMGRRGEPTEVTEDRLEMILPQAALGPVLAALRTTHPYEEVAYDLYPLVATPHDRMGLGLVGRLPRPTAPAALQETLAEALHNPLVRLAAADRQHPVSRVAVIGGAGGGLIDDARRAGAELVVTGDVGHHAALDALTMGLAVIDAGHWGTEWPTMRAVDDALGMAAQARGLTAPVHPSLISTDPWTDWT